MSVAIRLSVAALLLIVAGLPILETWRALLMGAALLALVYSEPRASLRRLAVAAVIALAIVGVKRLLPRADIAEAHNAFLVLHDGEPLERGLPPVVFQSWRAQFDALYPPDDPPYQDRSQWRSSGTPASLFTQSADAIWRRAKYTRQVDAISFRNLGEFRGGFANEIQYNFWAGELLREQMPFYAMYQLTPASVGSALAWEGQAFWEQGDGRFEAVTHPAFAAREIRSEDVGRRVYAAFFPKRDGDRRFELQRSLTLRLSAWLVDLLTVAGIGVILFLTMRPRLRSLLRALAITAISYGLMMSFIVVSAGKYLGGAYPPQGGGDDGIVHDGWGRMMAMLAGRGDVVRAMQGAEDVYWFTPGTRYVRMLEKLVFGDTNLLFALLVAATPLLVFNLIRHFAGTRWAWGVTVFFWLMPVGNLSFLAQIANAKLGYGDTIAGSVFMLALVLLLRNEPAWGGVASSHFEIWAAGAALAAAMFIRPNFALAVVWMGAAFAWALWRRRDVLQIAVFGCGLGLALWMPFHNWFYGGQFYLISKSGATASVPLGVGDYLLALADLVRWRTGSDAVSRTAPHVVGWLWNPGLLVRPELMPLAWIAHAFKLLALAVTGTVALRWAVRRWDRHPALPLIAVAALLAHVPMLFVFAPQYRYAMLAWDLSLLVMFAAVGSGHRARQQRAVAQVRST